MNTYNIAYASKPPPLDGRWDDPAWAAAGIAAVNSFHPRSSDHHPRTEARLLYDDDALYLFFMVRDRYVRAVAMDYQGPTCKDSCVEFFVEPAPARGYFNFEFNCVGTTLLYFIEDPAPAGNWFKKSTAVDATLFKQVRLFHGLRGPIAEEIASPLDWPIACRIPFSLFEHFLGPLPPRTGRSWRANFYKCGSQTSHPHWAAWSPIGEELNFHQPAYFGELHFTGK